MEQTNETTLSYFIINGIADVPQLQTLVFILFLIIYLIAVGGNMTILLLVFLDPQLHTPMYFFLCNLSIVDITSITITLHKQLLMFITGDKTIPYFACMLQIYIFLCLATNELLILTVMSYDRYVAICKPLHYNMIMTHRVCTLMTIVCWVLGFLEVVPFLALFLQISCYRSNIINHFFCDLVPLMKISCSDTSVLEILTLTDGLLILGLTPFVLTFIPYSFIISTILSISTSTGRHKAFYTCSSHITVVILLYVTLLWQYVKPSSKFTSELKKIFALFNTSAVPILNPLIYSLKNKDVKMALRRQWEFLGFQCQKTFT
ncbi:olfactory receptor 6C74-like [Discoglossus pictus]